MTPIVARPLPRDTQLSGARPAAERRTVPAPRPRAWREPFGVFAISFAAYGALGLYTTLALKIVLGDGESRLAHAYFTLWNTPGKLAAIGFYWPPMQTLALIPFAAVRPLATSLVALPIASALFAAAVLATLDRALALAHGLPRRLRWAIVGAFGLNPMFLYFAVNGMGESLYLFFLTAGLFFFVRWTISPRWQDLLGAGVALALGVLGRYEVGVWVVIVAAATLAILAASRADAARIEASVVALVAPTIYALALWAFVNWTLTGRPASFLSVANAIEQPPHGTLVGFARQTASIQLQLFPAVAAVALALSWIALRRRSIVATALAAALVVNAFITIAFAYHAREDVPLLLRYNMRAMPLAIVAGAWLIATTRHSRRTAAGVALLAGIVLSAPATATIMLHSKNELGEASFLRGLATGQGQDGRPGPHGPGLSIADQRSMARWIVEHIQGRNQILADDSQTFGVMLADGDPGRYLDRIDYGDRTWFEIRDDPQGRVRYMLVKRGATASENRVFYDRILQRYSTLGTPRPAPPFLQLVRQNGTFALYRVHPVRRY